MMILNRLLLILLNVFEAYVWFKIANLFLKRRYSVNVASFAAVIVAVIMITKSVLCWDNDNAVFNSMLTFINFGIILFLTVYLFKDSLRLKILIVLLYMVGLAISDILVMGIFLLTKETVVNDFTKPTIVITLISIISRYILLTLIRKFHDWQNNIVGVENKLQDMIFLMIITDFSLVFLTYIFYLNISRISPEMILLLIIFNIIIVTIVFIFNIYRLLRFSRQLTENRLKTQYMQMQLQQNENMYILSNNLRSLRHDMNNHIGVIYGLLDTKQYNKLKSYLNGIYKNLQEANDIIIVNNEILSIILNNKKHLANEKMIQLVTWIEVKDFILTEIEICSLIGNILDNAIEATEKVPFDAIDIDREIKFVCVEKEEGWYIDCKNPFVEVPLITEEGLMTTKKNKESHGIGSRTMQDIIKKYNGTLEYSTDDINFIVKIFISKKSNRSYQKEKNM
ncbi:MAG: GHKL domain-containing protein [Clostridiales bacterium]|nr:GHKL domain-containing protein [Clostridiales bacterium]